MIRRVLLFTALMAVLAGCTPPANNSNSAGIVPSRPSPAERRAAAPAQITLPLLDALLTDDKFVEQLRTRLELANEQIASLKRVSNEEIDRLRETNAEELNGDGSASDPRDHAAEQLRSILGDEKANELASLANEYWAKGNPEEASEDAQPLEMLPGPNAVPTDTRVVINIPAFRMDLFQDGSLIKSYLVGIGYPQFPLPQGLRRAQTIIFNPTWTPPHSPWVSSMKNVTPGETVPAGSKANPLGIIKIPIGLPSLIHGGKAPAKIGKFASHGCVGLTNNQVKDFALLLASVSGTELSEATMAEYLRNRSRTHSVKLNQTVPVELRYETIVLEDGKLHIYKDVYAQKTNTEENLRGVLEAHDVSFEDLSEQQQTEVLDALKSISGKKEKEIVIDLSALSQKGYPAPVNLDSGADKPVRTLRSSRS